MEHSIRQPRARHLRIAAVVAAGGASLVAAALAFASIPGPGGVITGCYDTKHGNLRVVDSDASCANGETTLTWNQTGPQGPAGLQGPAGPPGSSFPLNLAVRQGTQVEVLGWGHALTASCQPGEVATGGGATVSGGSGQGRLVQSAPSPTTDGAAPTRWTVDVHSDSVNTSVTVIPYATCAVVRSNVTVRKGTQVEVLGWGHSLVASCQPGEIATGGGATVSGGSGQGRLVQSAPSPTTEGVTPTGWTVDVHSNDANASVTVNPFVVCAATP